MRRAGSTRRWTPAPARAGLDAGWRAAATGGFQLTIDLAPLTSAEAETIARSFAAAEDFAAKCVERAGGNPLFLEQLLRAARDLVDGKLPSTVQSVVLARVDLLAPNDRRAIEAASVLGQRFALATLRAQTVRMALHPETRKLVRHGRIRTRRPVEPMSEPPHSRQADPRKRSRRLGGPSQQASRKGQLAIHHRRCPA